MKKGNKSLVVILLVLAACLIAAARLNIPAIIVTGGAMLAGVHKGRRVGNQDMNDAGSGFRKGVRMTKEEMSALTDDLCGTVGGCWGMGTANTMACLVEAIGMSLPYCACAHAVDVKKTHIAKRSGIAIVDLVRKNIRPSDIMTREAFENCMIVNEAIAGSTNTFLHLPAVAHELGVDLPIETFDTVSEQTPLICNVMPAGPYYMSDLRDAGGIPAVMKELKPLLHKDVMTVTGKTLEENLEGVENYDTGIIHPISDPIKKTGSHVVVKGNIAPQGAVIKRAAVPAVMMKHRGPARVFEDCEGAIEAIRSRDVVPGDVVVIRYEGPKGGPGMREMVDITRTLSSIGYEDKVGLITDGRFSGYSSGAVFGHVSPEAQEGGPIALVRDGDMISYDIEARTITLEVSDEELAERRKSWKPKEINYKGYLARYSRQARSAIAGASLQ